MNLETIFACTCIFFCVINRNQRNQKFTCCYGRNVRKFQTLLRSRKAFYVHPSKNHHLSIRYLLVTDLINDTGEMRPQRLEKILRVVFNHAFFFFFTNVHDCTWGKVEVFLTTHDLNPSFFVGYSEFPSIYIGLGGLIFWSFFKIVFHSILDR